MGGSEASFELGPDRTGIRGKRDAVQIARGKGQLLHGAMDDHTGVPAQRISGELHQK